MLQTIKKLFRKTVKVSNRRRFKRIRAAYLVKYQINGKGDPRITNARDISGGGVRFWTKDKVPDNSFLNISVYLPPLERSVDAVAQVLRVRRSKESFVYSVAVSFLDIKKEDREAIDQFAELLSKDQNARLMIDHADIVIRQKQ